MRPARNAGIRRQAGPAGPVATRRDRPQNPRKSRITQSPTSVRHGESPLAEVLGAVTDAEERLTRLRDSPGIPDQPDRHWVDGWLHRSYLKFWTRIQ